METQTRVCQNCAYEFIIEPDDFSFHEKIKVPPPTWCPECQMRRLMMWRNERSLYKRKDASSDKNIISIFSPDKPFMVYERGRWWSDDWDPLSYGKEYDFSKPFFNQFRELLERVPLESLFNKNAVNSDYCNHSEDLKNCYLTFASIWNENVSYARGAIKCKDSMDILFCDKSELLYENIGCEECYHVSFSKNSSSCTDSAFLVDCRGCNNCFGCINLRNKSYYIFNQSYTKEEYSKKIKELDLGSFGTLQKIKSQCQELFKKYPYRYAHIINSPNSSGETIWNCKNCKRCFDVTENAENCSYIVNSGWNIKDSRSGYGCGLGDLMYEIVDTGIGSSRIFSTVVFRNGTDVSYAFDCHSSSNLFGCVGLRKKQYCILNKQYSKEGYETLVPRIIQHMNEMPYISQVGSSKIGVRKIVYKYGEFFPPELSPFAYNETIAQEYYPLTKEQAIEQGYQWKEPEPRNYQITVTTEQIPDHIKDAKDSITDEVIACANNSDARGGRSPDPQASGCTQAFKIILSELQFYKKLNLPLPRLCPNCRHYQRLKQRNPLKLWHRQCACAGSTSSPQAGSSSDNNLYKNATRHFHEKDYCPNEFETSYAPERPEVIYCEQCYQTEVV